MTTSTATAETRPQAKDGGAAAGTAAVIREIGTLTGGSGGLAVVAFTVLAVLFITSSSMGSVPETDRATVATAAFTVLGTIVGAYFGVRVGARGKEEAEAARAVASEKVERLAAHMDAEKANLVLDSLAQPVDRRR